MKVICSLILSCFTAVSASARDSTEMHRDRINLCNQFVIEEARPMIQGTAVYRIDCHALGWDETYHRRIKFDPSANPAAD